MSKPDAKSLPSLSIRIDLDSESRIGPGKILLLENIHASGSISAACRAMDMSYKRAWDLVDEINRICRQVAVERQTGGKQGGGADPDAVRPLARGALPQDRTRRGERRPQGVAGVADRDWQSEEGLKSGSPPQQDCRRPALTGR